MYSKKRKILFICISVIMVLSLAACGAGSKNDAESTADSFDGGGGYYDYDYASPSDSLGVKNNSDRENQNAYTANSSLKIIYTSEVSIETKQFDDSYKNLESLIAQYGGYISEVSSSGGYTRSDGGYVAQRANLTIRIPVENYQAFLNGTNEIGTVTDLYSYTNDVTTSYIDTASRLEALEAQKEQLMSYLNSAANVTEMLEIQDRLYDVIYEIESNQSRLNMYDNLIDYSTVYLHIKDVSNVTAFSRTFGEDFVEAVGNSWRSVVNFIQWLVIAIVWIIPYAVFFAIVFIIIRVIIRAVNKKYPEHAEKRAAKKAAKREEKMIKRSGKYKQ